MIKGGFGALRFALLFLFSVTVVCVLAHADQPTATRIGVIYPLGSATFAEGLRDGLHQAGYSEGSNLTVEWRRPSETEGELRSVVSDLVRSKVDLIVTTGTPAARAALQGAALPVVFLSGDPVRAGLATSLAKPGGNGTGVSALTPELEVKRLELLHQLAPKARRIGYLNSLSNPQSKRQIPGFEAAARGLGVQIEILDAADPGELDVALRALQENPPEALQVAANVFFLPHSAAIARAVRKSRIPAMYAYREFVEDGGLASYGPDLKRIGGVMAGYVIKILKGAKPSELPIEQMSEYELVINLRVARELRIKVPQELLLRADEVIR